MTHAASGNMTGLGTPIMYARMAQDLIRSCAHLMASAGRAIRSRHEHGRGADEWLRQLETTLLLHEYAPGTVRKYCACVAAFVREGRWTSPTKLTGSHVQRHLAGLRASGLGNASLRLHLCAIRTVFDKILGRCHGQVESDP